MTQKKQMNAKEHHEGVFDTPGGRSYLENLRSLHASKETQKAVERAKRQEKK